MDAVGVVSVSSRGERGVDPPPAVHQGRRDSPLGAAHAAPAAAAKPAAAAAPPKPDASGKVVIEVGDLLKFGVTNERAWEVGLSCGGEIEVYVERIA